MRFDSSNHFLIADSTLLKNRTQSSTKDLLASIQRPPFTPTSRLTHFLSCVRCKILDFKPRLKTHSKAPTRFSLTHFLVSRTP